MLQPSAKQSLSQKTSEKTYCPRCGHRLHRRHRKGHERVVSFFAKSRPYYCSNSVCFWTGWLPLDPS
jgi:predicted RNA-binding Zn-ribbon protein involved in translation (DUF1610 family)